MKKNAFNIIWLFLILIMFNEPVRAKIKATLTGRIMDVQIKEPLIGANVWLDGTGFGSATDKNGKYVIVNVPPGDYVLRISYIGYQEVRDSIRVKVGQTIRKDYALQYAGALEGESISVTAQAKGQMSAINEQLNSPLIKNVVSSDRILELPDANAAESVGRLPGVSVLRVGGEGNKVVVRGLAPKYNKITLDGVSLPSTGGDRSTDISMISPYSLGGIEVMKAVTADQDADYLGGTVNFKLREPVPGLKYDIVAQAGYNGLKGTYSDYMLTGSVSNRLWGDKVGFYFQANMERRNRSSNRLSAGYELKNPEINKVNTVYTQSLAVTDAIRERSRFGGTLVFDYRIPEGVIRFKNFYNSGETSVNRYSERFSVNDRTHQYETRDEQYKLAVLINVVDYAQRFGPLSVDAKISQSSMTNEVPTDLGFSFYQVAALSSDVLNSIVPPNRLINYASINDSTSFFQYLNEGYRKTRDKHIGAQFNVRYDFSISKRVNGNVKFGGKYRYKDRFFNKDVYSGNFNLYSGQGVKNAILNAFPWMQEIAPIGSQKLPYILFYDRDFDHGDFLNGEYSMGPVVDIDLMHQVLQVVKQVENPSLETYTKHDFYSNREDYSGNEYLSAGYLMAELNFGAGIKFIPGVRYERNETVYTAARGDASLPFPNQHYVHHDTTTTRINDFFLPMIHLKYSPVAWFNVRLAYTHTLSRPSYNLIMPRIDIMRDAVIWNNYKLEPEFSRNIDVYLTFKQNHLGLFTLGGFTKSIENMIYWLDKRVILNSQEYELPESVVNKYIYTQANNPYEATVRGIEADWQTNFWYLPGALKGLVLNLNYTHIFSESRYPRTVIEKKMDTRTFQYIYTNIDTFYTDRLQFQPDNIVNFQLGYDYKGFSARLSMLYQSKIFQRPSFWPELSTYSDEYLRWDFSVKQKLPWLGLQLFCNISNITAAMDRDLNSGSRFPTSIQHYGRTVDLGLRVRM